MTQVDLTLLSNQELEKLYNKIKWAYDHEDKPLYKRHLGGRLLTILKEIKRRGNEH